MKALITGSPGFIGSHLVKYFESRDLAFSVLEGDLLDSANLEKFFLENKNATSLIHLAAISSVQDGDKDFKKLMDVNLLGTTLVLEMIRKHNPQMNFIFPSTAQVYKSAPDGQKILETAEIFPQSNYALSKWLAEQAISEYQKLYNLRCTTLRIFNHSHKSQPPNSFLSSVYHQCLAAKEKGMDELELKVGNLDIVRDFSPLQSLLEVFVKLCQTESSGPALRVFNVCNSAGFNLQELANALAKAMGLNVKFTVEPSRVRQGDVPVMVGDNSRLRKYIGMAHSSVSIEGFVAQFLATI